MTDYSRGKLPADAVRHRFDHSHASSKSEDSLSSCIPALSRLIAGGCTPHVSYDIAKPSTPYRIVGCIREVVPRQLLFTSVRDSGSRRTKREGGHERKTLVRRDCRSGGSVDSGNGQLSIPTMNGLRWSMHLQNTSRLQMNNNRIDFRPTIHLCMLYIVIDTKLDREGHADRLFTGLRSCRMAKDVELVCIVQKSRMLASQMKTQNETRNFLAQAAGAVGSRSPDVQESANNCGVCRRTA